MWSTAVGRGSCVDCVVGQEAIVGAVDKVGVDFDEGKDVRWTGFRATGGGAFLDDELVVEVDMRRSVIV